MPLLSKQPPLRLHCCCPCSCCIAMCFASRIVLQKLARAQSHVEVVRRACQCGQAGQQHLSIESQEYSHSASQSRLTQGGTARMRAVCPGNGAAAAEECRCLSRWVAQNSIAFQGEWVSSLRQGIVCLTPWWRCLLCASHVPGASSGTVSVCMTGEASRPTALFFVAAQCHRDLFELPG